MRFHRNLLLLLAALPVFLLFAVNFFHASTALSGYYFPDNNELAYIFHASAPGRYIVSAPFPNVYVTDSTGRLHDVNFYISPSARPVSYWAKGGVLFINLSGLKSGETRTYIAVPSDTPGDLNIFPVAIPPSSFTCQSGTCHFDASVGYVRRGRAYANLPSGFATITSAYRWGVYFRGYVDVPSSSADAYSYYFISNYHLGWRSGGSPNTIRFYYANPTWHYGGYFSTPHSWADWVFAYRPSGSYATVVVNGRYAAQYAPNISASRIYVYGNYTWGNSGRPPATLYFSTFYFFRVPAVSVSVTPAGPAYIITVTNTTSLDLNSWYILPLHIGSSPYVAYPADGNFVVSVSAAGTYYIFDGNSAASVSTATAHLLTSPTNILLTPTTFSISDFNSGTYSLPYSACLVRATSPCGTELNVFTSCSDLNIAQYLDCSYPDAGYVYATVRSFSTAPVHVDYLSLRPGSSASRGYLPMYVYVRGTSAPADSCSNNDIYVIATDGNFPLSGIHCYFRLRNRLLEGTTTSSGAVAFYSVRVCDGDPFSVFCYDTRDPPQYRPAYFSFVANPTTPAFEITDSNATPIPESNVPSTGSPSTTTTTATATSQSPMIIRRTYVAPVPVSSASGALSTVPLSISLPLLAFLVLATIAFYLFYRMHHQRS